MPHKLPTVLSQDEAVRLIDAAPNRLYRMILVLLYATGVRRTEAARIKVEDIDSQRMVIHIRQGKGARDRDVPLSPKLLEELRSWWRWKKPTSSSHDVTSMPPSTAGADHASCRTAGPEAMSRPPFEVADIIRISGDSFRQRYSASLTWPQRKVLDAIVRCRTAALGGHRDACVRRLRTPGHLV